MVREHAGAETINYTEVDSVLEVLKERVDAVPTTAARSCGAWRTQSRLSRIASLLPGGFAVWL